MKEVKASHIDKELNKITPLDGRTPTSSGEDLSKAFTTLAPFEGGGVFVGTYEGEGAWERHTAGDEFVQIIEGCADLVLLLDSGEQILELLEGMVTVVPKGKWHRFISKGRVSVLTATPHPTEHSLADDPRI